MQLHKAAQSRANSFTPLGTAFLVPTFRNWNGWKFSARFVNHGVSFVKLLWPPVDVSKVNWNPPCVVDVVICEEIGVKI